MKKIFIIALMALFVCASSYAQTKRALVIGIGKYPAGSGWQRIHGDRDADSVMNMLAIAGFKDVQCIKNEKATKSNIMTAFKLLTTRCQKGDIVYIHFSGHGQQVKDVNGDETKDALDESWIPYDACVSLCAKDRGEKHLVDDEIGILLDRIYEKVGAKGKILVVVDACHSGSSTRHDEECEFVRGSSEVFQSDCISQVVQVQQNWILVSACADNQSNVELKEPSMGKLTCAITRLVKNGFKEDNATLKKRVQSFFDRHRSSQGEQTLMMSGMIDKFNIIQIFIE